MPCSAIALDSAGPLCQTPVMLKSHCVLRSGLLLLCGFISGLTGYQCAFTTPRSEWIEQPLSFQDFVPMFRGRILTGVPLLDPAQIWSVGFLIADKQAGAFRLEIASIRATRIQPARIRERPAPIPKP